MSTPPTAADVIEAWQAAKLAEDHYRDVLREAVKVRGTQAELITALNRSRETLRFDAMTDEQQEAARQADLDRKARRRERASKDS